MCVGLQALVDVTRGRNHRIGDNGTPCAQMSQNLALEAREHPEMRPVASVHDGLS